MTAVQQGQVWRNVYGAHVVINEIGYHQGCAVLWAYLCDADGAWLASEPIPLKPPVDGAGFPGELWTLTKDVT